MNQHAVHRGHHKHPHKHAHKHEHKRDWRGEWSRYAFGIGVALSVLALGLGAVIAWGVYQAHLYQDVYGPALEAELGFTTDTPSFQVGERKIEVSVIHPVQGGYMDKIGFRDGDVITSHTLTEFYKLLYWMQGESVSVDVVDGGNGAPLEERKVRTRRFLIPPRQ